MPQKTVHVIHASMQYGDTNKEKQQDYYKIFARARKRKVSWITGTEAGPGAGNATDLLHRYGDKFGFHIYAPSSTDSWIAVDTSIVKTPWFSGSYRKVINGKARHYTDKGPVSLQFDHKQLGKIGVITCHLQTKGRRKGDPRFEQNLKLARAINQKGKVLAKGVNLAFYAGDQNIVDRHADTFFGGGFLSTWDELAKWPNTGHGNIDVIASWKHDSRVKAKYSRVLNDSQFFLNTDHFLVEAGFIVNYR